MLAHIAAVLASWKLFFDGKKSKTKQNKTKQKKQNKIEKMKKITQPKHM